MPKKSRRAKAKHRARVAQALAQGRVVEMGSVPSAPQSALSPSPGERDSASRYQDIIDELKRIGVIAGAIIVVLIVLSFVLG